MAAHFDNDNLTVADYFLLEEESLERHEYLQGARRELSGSTIMHSQLVVSALSTIHSFLQESDYTLFHLQIKLCVEAKDFFAYPDLMIVNGEPQRWKGRDDTMVNPEVVIEIYTAETEAFDCGEKFRLYRRLPTLKEYVLLSAAEIRVERYVKQPDDSWNFYETKNPEDYFQIETIGFACPVKELYRNVSFELID